MEIIPAIDLRNGQVVRLHQGHYDEEIIYSNDPIRIAIEFAAAGARRLHVIDLDGAQSGTPTNSSIYMKFAEETKALIQVGGGLRTIEMVSTVLNSGANRVVLGTSAITNPALVKQSLDYFGAARVLVALDARDGMVSVQGWTEQTETSADELLKQMAELGIIRFVYTDINRDGTLTGPNFKAIENVVQVARSLNTTVIASGGISDINQLTRLAALGIEGAIVGKALYTGTLDLKHSIQEIHRL